MNTNIPESERVADKEAVMVGYLRQLLAASPDIEGAAVMTCDGLTLAAVLPPPTEPDRVSAMGAALLSLAERITHELGRGDLDQVYTRGAHGDILLTSVGIYAVLVVVTRPNAKLGLLLYYIKRTMTNLLPLVQYLA